MIHTSSRSAAALNESGAINDPVTGRRFIPAGVIPQHLTNSPDRQSTRPGPRHTLVTLSQRARPLLWSILPAVGGSRSTRYPKRLLRAGGLGWTAGATTRTWPSLPYPSLPHAETPPLERVGPSLRIHPAAPYVGIPATRPPYENRSGGDSESDRSARRATCSCCRFPPTPSSPIALLPSCPARPPRQTPPGRALGAQRRALVTRPAWACALTLRRRRGTDSAASARPLLA